MYLRYAYASAYQPHDRWHHAHLLFCAGMREWEYTGVGYLRMYRAVHPTAMQALVSSWLFFRQLITARATSRPIL